MAFVSLAALLLTVVAYGGEQEARAKALANCDRIALEGPRVERDYACYVQVARKGGAKDVLRHVEAQLGRFPEDCQLWLTFGATQEDYGQDPKAAYRSAAEHCAANGLAPYQIQALLNLGRRIGLEGDAVQATALLREAKDIADGLQHPLLIAAATFELTAALLAADGDLLGALDDATRAYAQLDDQTPYQVRRNGAHYLARINAALGRFSQSARWADESAKVATAAGDLHSALHPRRFAAHKRRLSAWQRFDTRAVERFQSELLSIREDAVALDNPMAQLDSTRVLAPWASRSEAEREFQACISQARALDQTNAQRVCEIELAEVTVDRDPAAAVDIADRIATTVEAEGSPEARVGARQSQGRIRWATGDLEGAWEAWQAMLLATDERTKEQDRSEARRIVHGRSVGRHKLAAGALLHSAPDDRKWVGRALSVMERMRAREALEFRRQAHLPHADVSNTTVVATVDQVAARLGDDEAMLVYQLGHDTQGGWRFLGGSWVLVVTRDEVTVHRLAEMATLGPAIAMVADGLRGQSNAALDSAIESLSQSVLAAAMSELPASVRRLVIVPDGPLHRLPFAALRTSQGEPLVHSYTLTTALSATAWLAQSRDERLPRNILALADPSPSVVGATPDELTPDQVVSLPGARAEAAYAIATLGGSSALYQGAQATETVLERAAEFSVVHIAAHAVVDAADPASTAVVLSPGTEHNGIVGLESLSQHDFSGALVVLAACQGADGELVAGEGPLSLARALFVGGARTVIAGLWPVPDEQAAALFADFYRALDQGATVSAALAYAQTERRRAGAPASAWAGFVVYGDGNARLTESAKIAIGWWILLASLLGGLVGWWIGRPRH